MWWMGEAIGEKNLSTLLLPLSLHASDTPSRHYVSLSPFLPYLIFPLPLPIHSSYSPLLPIMLLRLSV